MDSGQTANPVEREGRGVFCWALYDWANSAYPTLIQTFVFAAYFTGSVAPNKEVGTAWWGHMLSISALIVALAGPMLGAIADQTGRRKPWMAGFTLLCCLSTAFLWYVEPSPDRVWLALILVGLGTLGVEYASIFYNAMLPQLVSDKRVGRWSGYGWALGYAGGLGCLLLALFGLVEPEWSWLDAQKKEHVRATFVLAAVWFGVFAVPLFFFTPDSPPTGKPFRQAAVDGCRQLWRSIRDVRRYSQVLQFLIARMIYNDGVTTIFVFGGIFAEGAFDMSTRKILYFGIALNVTAGLGAALLARLDDRLGSKPTIILSLVGLILASGAMLSVREEVWFWVFGLVLGIFVGPVQAASRSLMAHLSPPELRNQMFGLYAFSGKATSFLGPLMVAWVIGSTNSLRWGLSTVVLLFLVGLGLLWPVRSSREPARSK